MEGGNNLVAKKSRLTIRNWHAHLYFNADEAEAARSLCEAMRDALDVPMGHVHIGPVGPHPRGSCQITVPRNLIGEALEWLFAYRGDFTVFVHGNSGDDWADHTRHVIWIGPGETLDLSIFAPGSGA